MKTACPICGSSCMDYLITLEHVPYFENRLCDSVISAQQDGCGTQSMTQCQHCGFVFNRMFEPQNMVYGDGYHAERGGSEYYRQYLRSVAAQINSVAPIEGKRILEVACGTGEFLQVIAGYHPKVCIGVDPSANEASGNCTIRPELFDEAYLEKYPETTDILISRHMIEHMENPLEMLRTFAKALPVGGVLYLETPRLDWILENRVFYDFSYEHCSYFTDEFMERLLTAAGFSVTEMKPGFDGQYFSILARRGNAACELATAGQETLDRVKRSFRSVEEQGNSI